MAYHITVLEPGKKRIKLYAGKGNLTSKLIHAVQYPSAKREDLESWVAELNRDNPGFTFALREVPHNQNIVDRG